MAASSEIKEATEPYTEIARAYVVEYFNEHREKTEQSSSDFTMTKDHTFVVKSSFILGNWKVWVSTTVPDGMYYEVTYDKAKGRTYLDAYKKFNNVCYFDVPIEVETQDVMDVLAEAAASPTVQRSYTKDRTQKTYGDDLAPGVDELS